MISRLWHGWTAPEAADRYEDLLRSTIFPGILARDIAGFRRIELARRQMGDEVEFLTTMWFDSWSSVEAFAGPDREVSVVPEAARRLLSRFDAVAQHYEVCDSSAP
jgi:antibiotic biosynthesis monooxygenase (ABM) superfamily enzyme